MVNQANSVFQVSSVLKQAFQWHQAGQFHQAEAGYRHVLAMQPNNSDAMHLLGLLAESAGRLDVARDLVEKAIRVKPREVLYCLSLARILQALVLPSEAEAQARKALRLQPGNHEARYMLANALKVQAQLPEAIREYERVLAINPRHAGALNNLGSSFNDMGRFDAALACLKKFLAIHPGSFDGLCGAGNVLHSMGRFAEALDYFDQALKIRLDAGVQYDQALCLLGLGQLDRGWADYAARFYKSGEAVMQRPFAHPVWNGGELEGKTLLIWGEQGIGDEMLFAEGIASVIGAGAKVVLECEPRLAMLFARSFPDAEICERTTPPHPRLLQGDINFQVAAGSLAGYLHPTVESFSKNGEGYLKPDPERVKYWEEWLSGFGNMPKIGIAWRSMFRRQDRDAYYTELLQWGEILKTPGILFVNLQYGDCREELEEVGQLFGVAIHEAPELNLKDELDEAAALIKALDLVIAPNSSVFAMAGAVGSRTWLLNLERDWGMLGTKQVPWFPTVKVYSKEWNLPWETLLADVARDLALVAAGAVDGL